MQKSAELLSRLGDHVDAINAYIRSLDDYTLAALRRNLPSKSPTGTAETVMRLLVQQEIERRVQTAAGGNVVLLHDRSGQR